ncbi:MAG: pilus assembly protein [Proteobacteria bacterium SG_bin7]|nr:MAG: pilus assembly protein [Proteobacteria bacterium SG_bin7]
MSAAEERRAQIYRESLENYLRPISGFLRDSSVTEILINGPNEIFIERAGKLMRTDVRFSSDDELLVAINNIAQSVRRRIDESNPRMDARLPDGSRIHVVLPPVARNGATVAIRKFSQTEITFKKYLEFGAITPDAAQFLDVCMFLGKNILVSGGTGSGKTTLLGILCNRIPKGQRIIVIEDATELKIHYEHVVFFEARMPDAEGKGAVTIEDLLKSSLRLRPDRIIVGEVRGSEAYDLIQAMNTGHKGCLGTVHSNTPADALVRLEALAQGAGDNISIKALQQQIGSAIDLVVQVSRLSDGSRKVTDITEVHGVDDKGNYITSDIYKMGQLIRGEGGKLSGSIQPVGNIPKFMNEIEDNRIPFPRTKFNAA